MRCDARGLVHVHVHDQPVHHARNVQNVEAHDREEALHLASRIENLGQGKKPDHDHDWTVSPVGVPTSHHNQFVSGVCSTSTAAATSRLHDESLESRRPIKVPDLSKPPPCHKFSDRLRTFVRSCTFRSCSGDAELRAARAPLQGAALPNLLPVHLAPSVHLARTRQTIFAGASLYSTFVLS